VWEDPLNITGGKWIIRLKKGVADRLWEDLILAIIGDQFDEPLPAPAQIRSHSRNSTGEDSIGEEGPEWPGICGCTISIRQSEDIISIWNRFEADPKVRDKIRWKIFGFSCLDSVLTGTPRRDTVRKALNLSPSTIMEYKTNNGE
jgi:translation initiation factor 4E